ncbi:MULTISPECIES: heavy metal translocating P-type ATPase [Francisella]|uniref:P-type Zn(2+) transporter n=1 Tax=Francisella opportunistica TaxID=2016517 RepID=A0A345JSR2_9GAMM|nr:MULTISPECIES: heavy metal translocating P-type ATPase [Francisella]APC92133.1 Lead, cadmium, zinc and mercury transporting ATPase, copper-translocating P-type ATPase [Francisella sp. MA067296]AXH30358.1 heavy metal translocating P-type ATPase [Francisella opportunistica]AXH31999.1 heavy metal translocating P-type ATPase [Francisella opportunistica]AXH33646.1 heavy metal translocating P-type ATPase [Francisella opportunistica]
MNNTQQYLKFKVYGLDCIEEVNIIKKALAKKVAEQSMQFDLLNGKLSINASDISTKEIIALIKKSGLKASTWDEYISKNRDTNFYNKHSRLITTIISGIFIVFGYIYHGIASGFIHAFIANDNSEQVTPFIPQMAYLLAIVFGSWFVVPKALASLKRLAADMNLLMLIAIIGALIIGQLFEAAVVSFLFAFSLLLESWSINNARSAITKLMQLTPDKALVYCCHDKQFEEKPIAEINIGKRVLIKPGQRIALDGVIIKGSGYINQAPITGESIPVEKTINDEVFAGSINGSSTIEIKTTKTADNSSVAKIIQAIEHAQAKRSKAEKWVDKFARIYTPTMIVLALLIAILPPLFLGQAWLKWIYQALVILVIACPCALVISTPISIVSSLAKAARNGILIKGGEFIEIPATLKAIAFDKTGTLTLGQPSITEIVVAENFSKQYLITIAASLESTVDHPIAQAVLDYANNNNIIFTQASNTEVISGKGVTGEIDNNSFWLGNHAFAHEKQLCNNSLLHQKATKLEDSGLTLIFIGNSKDIIGIIAIQDKIKDNINGCLKQLKSLGISQTIMLTGDNPATAKAIATQAGINSFYAELLPQDKVTKVEELVNSYASVAMVGDGINDAPALATAKLGIAMAAIGNDIAIETADIALMTDDISKLAWLIKHSKKTLKIIKQNISFAIAIKAIFISLAMLDLATLWMAIAADMGATLIVIINSLRLLK